jgi:hypothetical protein
MRQKINCRAYYIWVADCRDKILYHIRRDLRRQTDNLTVVTHTKVNVTTETVQERANRFVSVRADTIAATLELNRYSFTYRENILQFIGRHYFSSFGLSGTICLSSFLVLSS